MISSYLVTPACSRVGVREPEREDGGRRPRAFLDFSIAPAGIGAAIDLQVIGTSRWQLSARI
jgi:hypothetical protein